MILHAGIFPGRHKHHNFIDLKSGKGQHHRSSKGVRFQGLNLLIAVFIKMLFGFFFFFLLELDKVLKNIKRKENERIGY